MIKATELAELLLDRVRKDGDFTVACIVRTVDPPLEMKLVVGEMDETIYDFDCNLIENLGFVHDEPSPPATAGGTDSLADNDSITQ